MWRSLCQRVLVWQVWYLCSKIHWQCSLKGPSGVADVEFKRKKTKANICFSWYKFIYFFPVWYSCLIKQKTYSTSRCSEQFENLWLRTRIFSLNGFLVPLLVVHLVDNLKESVFFTSFVAFLQSLNFGYYNMLTSEMIQLMTTEM